MPTISQTLSSLRTQIATDLGDHIGGTASGGSTTTLTDTGEIARYAAGTLIGAEISTISGTGSGQTNTITGHTVSSGTVTLTVPTWTAVDSTTVYEIHRLRGHGYTKAQYDNAIYQVIDALADRLWTDHSDVSMAIECRGGLRGTYRREFPVPSGFVGINAVEVLEARPATHNGLATMDTWRALGDATARTRLSQGFQVPQDGFYSYIAFYMDKVGSPTGNLTCVVETDSSDLPSGTAVTNGTSTAITGSTLSTQGRYVVFVFDPMFLEAGTQYHATLRRSDAVSGSAYWRVAEDTDGSYNDGTLATYDSSSWTAVSGSDLIFAVSEAGTSWARLAPIYWGYQNLATDQLFLRQPEQWAEGTPIRVVGGAAIARPSTESTTIPARPEFVSAAAKALLTGNLTGQPSRVNHRQAAQWFLGIQGLVPPARRQWPADWIPVVS